MVALVCPAPAVASETALPNGETVLDLRFSGDDLIVLVRKSENLALRRFRAAAGELEVIGVPRSLAELKADGARGELAPDGGALAVMTPATGGSPARLVVCKLVGNRLDDVPVRLPAGFVCAGFAWDGISGALYLHAAPYIAPEQPYSIGAVDLDSGRFTGLVRRDSLDIIHELAAADGRLLVRCGGYRGEYPAAQLLARIEPNGAAELLHADAAGLHLHSLADGTLLALGRAARERFALPHAADALVALDGLTAQARIVRSAEGWRGVLVDARLLKRTGDAAYAVLEHADGRRLSWPEAASLLALSADGRHGAVASAAGTRIAVFELPQ